MGVDVSQAKEIVVISHEGLISAEIELEVDGKPMCVKNEPRAWEALKVALDFGVNIVVHRKMYGGEIRKQAFRDSAMYLCRFDKARYAKEVRHGV